MIYIFLEDGECWSWGNNDKGSLGIGIKERKLSPQIVPLSDIKQVFAGKASAFALDSNYLFSIEIHTVGSGQLFSWGRNDYGQLGLGHNQKQDTPQKVSIESIRLFSTGLHHSLAVGGLLLHFS